MRYSTSYAKPGPKSGGHLLTAPGILFRVTPPSTNQCSLTSMIKWVPVCPTCQDTVLPKLILNLVLLRRRVTEKSHFSSLKVVLTGIRTRYRYYNNPCSYRVNHPLQLSYTCYPSIQQIPRDRISYGKLLLVTSQAIKLGFFSSFSYAIRNYGNLLLTKERYDDVLLWYDELLEAKHLLANAHAIAIAACLQGRHYT
jgi:hypothetical protein